MNSPGPMDDSKSPEAAALWDLEKKTDYKGNAACSSAVRMDPGLSN